MYEYMNFSYNLVMYLETLMRLFSWPLYLLSIAVVLEWKNAPLQSYLRQK